MLRTIETVNHDEFSGNTIRASWTKFDYGLDTARDRDDFIQVLRDRLPSGILLRSIGKRFEKTFLDVVVPPSPQKREAQALLRESERSLAAGDKSVELLMRNIRTTQGDGIVEQFVRERLSKSQAERIRHLEDQAEKRRIPGPYVRLTNLENSDDSSRAFSC
jgi:hypothetical protein